MKLSRKDKKQLQESEKQRIKEIFQSFDTDGSGDIDKNEFLEGMKGYFNLTNMSYANDFDHIFVTIFNLADKASLFRKKNGTLDVKEFTKVIKAIPSDFNPNDMTDINQQRIIGETLFNMIDDNGNQSISKSEFQKLCKYLNYDKKTTSSAYKTIDEDNSHSISLEEFLRWFGEQK